MCVYVCVTLCMYAAYTRPQIPRQSYTRTMFFLDELMGFALNANRSSCYEVYTECLIVSLRHRLHTKLPYKKTEKIGVFLLFKRKSWITSSFLTYFLQTCCKIFAILQEIRWWFISARFPADNKNLWKTVKNPDFQS